MFRDWFRPDRTAKGVPGLDNSHEHDPRENTCTEQAPPPPPLAIPPALLPILSEQQPSTLHPDVPVTRKRPGTDREPAKPKPWEMKMSDVEWVFLNELYPQFPEAWQYIYERAMFRAGLTPATPPREQEIP